MVPWMAWRHPSGPPAIFFPDGPDKFAEWCGTRAVLSPTAPPWDPPYLGARVRHLHLIGTAGRWPRLSTCSCGDVGRRYLRRGAPLLMKIGERLRLMREGVPKLFKCCLRASKRGIHSYPDNVVGSLPLRPPAGIDVSPVLDMNDVRTWSAESKRRGAPPIWRSKCDLHTR